jgi:hypothetical protein
MSITDGFLSFSTFFGFVCEKFENTNGVIRIFDQRTDNIIAKRESTKGQINIYKARQGR